MQSVKLSKGSFVLSLSGDFCITNSSVRVWELADRM